MMTHAIPRAAPVRARRPMASRLLAAWALHRSRSALGALDAAALRDVGLSRRAASDEARRPAWDAPAWWCR